MGRVGSRASAREVVFCQGVVRAGGGGREDDVGVGCSRVQNHTGEAVCALCAAPRQKNPQSSEGGTMDPRMCAYVGALRC